MFEIQNYSSFIITIIAFQLFPGAGTITILNATARRGVSIGMRTVYGTITGDFIYMLAAVLGLAAILAGYPETLKIAQWIGVIYLCWIGFKFLRVSGAEQLRNTTFAEEGWDYFRQALVVSLTNPKVVMYFMAFFPLFLSNESKPVTLFILMAHVTAISFLYQTCLVLVGNTIARSLSEWQYARKIVNRLVGILFIGFGLKLALNIR